MMNQNISLSSLLLTDIQPSQFYLSRLKLERVQSWFRPHDLSNFTPCPVYLLNGRVIFTDGHTRAYAAYKAGLRQIPLVWETDRLSWEQYQKCVDSCLLHSVHSVADLENRILTPEDYETKWLDWCRQIQGACSRSNFPTI